MFNLRAFTIDVSATLRDALQAIDKNARGIVFILDSSHVVGVISDGDARRALMNGIELKSNVSSSMNTNFVSLNINSSNQKIRETFTEELSLIPLVDNNGKLVDLADRIKNHRLPLMEPDLNGNELSYVQDCINTNWISSQGPYVARFEQMFAHLYSDMHALAVSSGTAGLHIALEALGISEGDEVIVPNITFAATANAVLYLNATPVLCEIDEETWCLDVSKAKDLISPRTKAIIPVHLYGQSCDMDQIIKLANEHKLMIIEDCAEAIGTKWKNKLVGTFADASVFSFFGNKTITTGEGGMIIFSNIEKMKNAKTLRDHGMSSTQRYWHDRVGYNYRLTNLQAAVGLAQLERLQEFIERKVDIAKRYKSILFDEQFIKRLPNEASEVFHSHWLYTIQLDEFVNSEQVGLDLLNYGIETRPTFFPLHKMPPYKNFRRSKSLKHSNNFSKQAISLPSFPGLTNSNIDYIAQSLLKVLRAYKK